MDLNQLLHQHQVAVIRAAAAPVQNLGSRFDLVSHYERRIARLRNQLGAAQYPSWLKMGATLSD
ncbi:hypothetical protein [Novosphingobium sp. M1R2S20]|uniref:Uncharacterized protein n=1 Tax=Novosphingobium rhizovicinum TaxID=3228928 RepID=A0ABV3RG24_9SPHN